MNKYVFPGADASCALGWVINKLEQAGEPPFPRCRLPRLAPSYHMISSLPSPYFRTLLTPTAGFEVKSVDVLGCHYSATLWRWYENWLAKLENTSQVGTTDAVEAIRANPALHLLNFFRMRAHRSLFTGDQFVRAAEISSRELRHMPQLNAMIGRGWIRAWRESGFLTI